MLLVVLWMLSICSLQNKKVAFVCNIVRVIKLLMSFICYLIVVMCFICVLLWVLCLNSHIALPFSILLINLFVFSPSPSSRSPSLAGIIADLDQSSSGEQSIAVCLLTNVSVLFISVFILCVVFR